MPRNLLAIAAFFASALASACVPPGNSTPSYADGGTSSKNVQAQPTFRPSSGVMTAPFFDDFDKAHATTPPTVATSLDPLTALAHAVEERQAVDGGPALSVRPALPAPAATNPADLGPDWAQAQTTAWHVDNGRLCGQNARNHGVWLRRILPPNARIEFDAVSDSPQGDLKAEVWGDGQSAATAISYTNATSYLTIFGGWKNSLHVLARINEHGDDRKEIKIDPLSDDPRQRSVVRGQTYRFKIERVDGKTVRWWVDNTEMLSFADAEPLVGFGHDHFGFNDWEVKVCFDNVRVTPL